MTCENLIECYTHGRIHKLSTKFNCRSLLNITFGHCAVCERETDFSHLINRWTNLLKLIDVILSAVASIIRSHDNTSPAISQPDNFRAQFHVN